MCLVRGALWAGGLEFVMRKVMRRVRQFTGEQSSQTVIPLYTCTVAVW